MGHPASEWALVDANGKTPLKKFQRYLKKPSSERVAAFLMPSSIRCVDAKHTMKEARSQGQQESALLYSPWKLKQRRNLQIENLTDPFSRRRTIRAGIRLKGGWLARAGFRPGERVAVILIEPGIMELRIIRESTQPAETMPLQRELMFQVARPRAVLAGESRKD